MHVLLMVSRILTFSQVQFQILLLIWQFFFTWQTKYSANCLQLFLTKYLNRKQSSKTGTNKEVNKNDESTSKRADTSQEGKGLSLFEKTFCPAAVPSNCHSARFTCSSVFLYQVIALCIYCSVSHVRHVSFMLCTLYDEFMEDSEMFTIHSYTLSIFMFCIRVLLFMYQRRKGHE